MKQNKTKKHLKKHKQLTLKSYKKKSVYKRQNNYFQNAVVDAHLHIRPFGGRPIEFMKMIKILNKSGILFAQIEGIGQRLPIDSKCDYYLGCPINLHPSMINDIINAQLVFDNNLFNIDGVKVNLSMTFPDLSKPDEVVKGIKYLELEFPNLFNWMGEVNVAKQALFKHGLTAVKMDIIPKWSKFMKMLRNKHMPISIHLDLGNDKNQTQFLPLLHEILRLYPNNIIVWMHMGLSKELTKINAKEHTEILSNLLSKYKNFYLDISWRILYDNLFSKPDKKQYYIDLMNKWPTRFLTGTDFVASFTKTEKVYKEELRITSLITNELNDKAFRQIALGQNYLDITRSKYKAPEVIS